MCKVVSCPQRPWPPLPDEHQLQRNHRFPHGAYIPTTPSPSQTLQMIKPLLQALQPVLETRVTKPVPPEWMDYATIEHFLSMSDSALHKLEKSPFDVVSSAPSIPFLCKLRDLSKPLFDPAVFPLYEPNSEAPLATDGGHSVVPAGHQPIHGYGRTKRRSKQRPRPAKRAQIKFVTSLLSESLSLTARPVTRILDVGAGHGHLSSHLVRHLPHDISVLAIENNPELISTASKLHRKRLEWQQLTSSPRSNLSFIQADAHSWQTVRNEGSHNDAIIGLHSCGCLGDTVLHRALDSNVSALVLVSCCLQKISTLSSTQRLPLSQTVLTDAMLRKFLTLSKSQLGLTNTARGYERPADLVARETRYAIRNFLEEHGKPVSRVGDEVYGLSRHTVRAGLRAVMPELVRLHGLDQYEHIHMLQDTEIERRQNQAHRDYRTMRALTLPRAFASIVLEMAVVLDRAALLEEVGYSVGTCRIWPDSISARNLTCVAWR